MSHLLVITRPELAVGFSLAGVEAYSAPDVETAMELIDGWLAEGESGLLAVDDTLLTKMDARILRRLEAAEQMLFLAIPGGEGAGESEYRYQRISELTRRAVGFHSIFKTETAEDNQK